MSAFDDLTLGEVEELTKTALGGKDIANADPLMLAGGVMWMTHRRDDIALTWDKFKENTRMSEIKEFSTSMEDDETNPTSVPPPTTP